MSGTSIIDAKIYALEAATIALHDLAAAFERWSAIERELRGLGDELAARAKLLKEQKMKGECQ